MNVVTVAVGGDRVGCVVPRDRLVGIVGGEGSKRRVDDLGGVESGGGDLAASLLLDPFVDQRRFKPGCWIERRGLARGGKR